MFAKKLLSNPAARRTLAAERPPNSSFFKTAAPDHSLRAQKGTLMEIDRRTFARQFAAGMVAAGTAAAARAEENVVGKPPIQPATEPSVHEAARDVPVVEETDVIVCGAGPAGVAAALAAARTGAKVRLLEVHGCLGGVWTAGLLTWLIDTKNKAGLMAEIIRKLDERGGQQTYRDGVKVAYDPEIMKSLLEDLCVADNVKVQLLTRIVAACRDESGKRLTTVITESKSGRQAWRAKVFIDATGDGDLGARAGCSFAVGHPDDGRTQPLSLMVLLTGIDSEECKHFIREIDPDAKANLLAEIKRAGMTPSYSLPTMFRIRDGLFSIMANHEYRVSAFDAQAITDATFRARREMNHMINALRGLGGKWGNVRLIATAEQIGVREGRRIRGIYEVSTNDLLVGARHADAICRVMAPIDVHSTDPTKMKGIEKQTMKAVPYDIPLRALIAKEVDGLMMAGRCISGDFIAHSSYRVTGNAVEMGQAAGATAAIAAASDRLPQAVPFGEVRQALARLNYFPGQA